MKRIQLKQLIREVVKEETSIGRKLNESDGKLPELMLILDFFADDQPNDDNKVMKVLKVLPNFNAIKKKMKFIYSIDFDSDEDDFYEEHAIDYADLICEGFEQLFKKMKVEGEAEMIEDEIIEVNITDPVNEKNVKFFESLGFE